MNKRMLIKLSIILKLIVSFIIAWYFWQVDDLTSITRLPMYILVFAVVYIALQILSRNLTKNHNWWDWVYYLGLISMMLPVLMANAHNEYLFQKITDFGVLFLIIPVFIDGYQNIKSPSKNN